MVFVRFICKVLICITYSLLLISASSSFPHGKINPLLHQQALSHLAFHSPSFKLALVKLFPASNAVAVVGVEWGEEVQLFARSGYHVYAFEPAKKFVRHLQQVMDRNPDWRVSLIPIAAGNSSTGEIDIIYHNENLTEKASRGTTDEHVRERLAVLSLDIQGDELYVLQGSSVTLSPKRGVDSIWVEAIACNEKVAQLLDILDDSYVIFDFVPWGKHVNDTSEDIPMKLRNFAFNPERLDAFDDFLKWMCEESTARYQWLQTDFLAVRRDLVAQRLMNQLSSLADQQCGLKAGLADCVLRKLLLPGSEKDEL